MPDSVYGLYPQPQQSAASGNPFDLLAKAATASSDLTIADRLQSELAGRKALGQLYGQHTNADGTIDTSGFLKDAATNLQAAFVLPELYGNILQQRGQQISNSTQFVQQNAAQLKPVLDFFGSLDPKTATPHTILSGITTLSRMYPSIPSPMLTGMAGMILDDPQGLAHGIGQAQNLSIGPTGIATRVSGPPTGAGAQTTIPIGQANLYPGGMPISNPPGFQERQAGLAQSDTQLAGNLASAAEGVPTRRALLGNLADTVDKFAAGPGADWTKVAKAFVNRNVPLPKGWQFDPGSIASQEEFVKQSSQLAQQQFAAIGGTGTDAKFASAFETNPNETLSNLGNHQIINLLRGNEDALQAKNAAWLKKSAANPNLSYRDFSAQFNANFDPRAFQFKYMGQKERQDYFNTMDPIDKQRFLHDVAYARKQGWVNY